MAKRPGAKKIDGEKFNFIFWSTNGDYAYAYMREHGCRSMAEAVNKIVDEHRRANSHSNNCAIISTGTKSVQ